MVSVVLIPCKIKIIYSNSNQLTMNITMYRHIHIDALTHARSVEKAEELTHIYYNHAKEKKYPRLTTSIQHRSSKSNHIYIPSPAAHSSQRQQKICFKYVRCRVQKTGVEDIRTGRGGGGKEIYCILIFNVPCQFVQPQRDEISMLCGWLGVGACMYM